MNIENPKNGDYLVGQHKWGGAPQKGIPYSLQWAAIAVARIVNVKNYRMARSFSEFDQMNKLATSGEK